MEKEIRITYEEIDILQMLLKNELEYYDRKEDIYKEDSEYIELLKNILKKIEVK